MNEIVVPPTWREKLEELAGGRRHLSTVAIVVAVVVIASLLLWSRGAPAQVAPPAEEGVTASPVPSGEVATGAASPAAVIYVHVAGAVRRPGLYELPAGSRVADAIASANGPRRNADLDAVNLAEPLVDGTKVDLPRRGEPPQTAPSGPVALPSAAGGGAGQATVDLNTADQTTLETVPGIGPVKAAAILQHRDQIGTFSSFEELLEVTGIGPATLETIRPYISF